MVYTSHNTKCCPALFRAWEVDRHSETSDLKLTLHTKNTIHWQRIWASSFIARSVLLLLRFPLYFIDLTFKSSSLSEGKKMTSQRWLQEWVKANNCWQLSRRLHSWEHITLMEVISDNHSLVQIRYKHQTLLRSHYTNLCIVFLTVHSYKY